MPVTEFVALKFKEPFTIDHPPILQEFQTILPKQAEWSGYPVTLYINAQDERLVYIISGWEDVEAHNKWIASQTNPKLLTYFTVDDFAHVSIDFAQFPTEAEVVTCRKSSVDDQHNGRGAEGGHTKNQGEIWAAEGKGEEKPTDLYRFAVFEAPQSNPDDSGFITLKRIHFNDAKV
jgi:hypothetical protein